MSEPDERNLYYAHVGPDGEIDVDSLAAVKTDVAGLGRKRRAEGWSIEMVEIRVVENCDHELIEHRDITGKLIGSACQKCGHYIRIEGHAQTESN